MKTMKINIMVLNYNGKDLLEECLPSVVEASSFSSTPCKVTVVDNNSTDNSVEYVKQAFASVDVINLRENKVLCSYNQALSMIEEDLVVLLNNDMKVEKDFLSPLIEMYKKHDDAFMIGPKCLSFDKVKYEGTRAKPFLRLGMFTSISRYPEHEKDADSPGLTMQSPFGLFDRRKFLFLKGFDEMYLPGIMEEADLCYRAYRYGFRCYYQPKSLIYHKGQVTFKKYYSSKEALSIAHRNSFLFMWKNISDPVILIKHALFIPIKLTLSLLRGRTELLSGLLKACSMLPIALEKRKSSSDYFKKSDREVISDVSTNLVSEQ